MNCRECYEFILRYLEGEMEAGERASFETHMGHCPPCERYLNQYKLAVQASKRACAEVSSAHPGRAPEELIRAILQSRNAKP